EHGETPARPSQAGARARRPRRARREPVRQDAAPQARTRPRRPHAAR
ncbi:MAG: hypothetical protein AVDCRST_MAG40-2898, partial [uncultured Gemmatimonadaceae bacterium]